MIGPDRHSGIAAAAAEIIADVQMRLRLVQARADLDYLRVDRMRVVADARRRVPMTYERLQWLSWLENYYVWVFQLAVGKEAGIPLDHDLHPRNSGYPRVIPFPPRAPPSASSVAVRHDWELEGFPEDWIGRHPTVEPHVFEGEQLPVVSIYDEAEEQKYPSRSPSPCHVSQLGSWQDRVVPEDWVNHSYAVTVNPGMRYCSHYVMEPHEEVREEFEDSRSWPYDQNAEEREDEAVAAPAYIDPRDNALVFIPPYRIPEDRSENESVEEECPICLEALDAAPMIQLACGHRYHTHCMARAYVESARCPTCRAVVPAGMIPPVLLPPQEGGAIIIDVPQPSLGERVYREDEGPGFDMIGGYEQRRVNINRWRRFRIPDLVYLGAYGRWSTTDHVLAHHTQTWARAVKYGHIFIDLPESVVLELCGWWSYRAMDVKYVEFRVSVAKCNDFCRALRLTGEQYAHVMLWAPCIALHIQYSRQEHASRLSSREYGCCCCGSARWEYCSRQFARSVRAFPTLHWGLLTVALLLIAAVIVACVVAFRQF